MQQLGARQGGLTSARPRSPTARGRHPCSFPPRLCRARQQRAAWARPAGQLELPLPVAAPLAARADTSATTRPRRAQSCACWRPSAAPCSCASARRSRPRRIWRRRGGARRGGPSRSCRCGGGGRAGGTACIWGMAATSDSCYQVWRRLQLHSRPCGISWSCLPWQAAWPELNHRAGIRVSHRLAERRGRAAAGRHRARPRRGPERLRRRRAGGGGLGGGLGGRQGGRG